MKRPVDHTALRDAALAAHEQSGAAGVWICGKARKDGTAQVYSPSDHNMRRVVPVAETTYKCGTFIALAHPSAVIDLLDEIKELRAQILISGL